MSRPFDGSANAGLRLEIISSSGLAGNFGQAAYSAAKMGLVGLMNTLGFEGRKRNVHVNCFAPMGTTRINDFLFTPAVQLAFQPSKVTPDLVYMASGQAPNRVILLGGAGSFERAYVTFTRGCHIENGEEIHTRFAEISDRSSECLPEDASVQAVVELANSNGPGCFSRASISLPGRARSHALEHRQSA